MCSFVHLSYHKRVELFFDWARRTVSSREAKEWDREDMRYFLDSLIEFGQFFIPDADEEMRENLEEGDGKFGEKRLCTVSSHPPYPFPDDATLQYKAPRMRDCPNCGLPEPMSPEPQVSDAGLCSQESRISGGAGRDQTAGIPAPQTGSSSHSSDGVQARQGESSGSSAVPKRALDAASDDEPGYGRPLRRHRH
ncbi:hypothetical protein OC835_006889 [Tilletia horrida]|nr:hypothetical protein OC835_006889 [Tilletia horrida]